jgi:hypothetical protein
MSFILSKVVIMDFMVGIALKDVAQTASTIPATILRVIALMDVKQDGEVQTAV